MLYSHPRTASYPRALRRFLAGSTLLARSQARSPQVTSEGPGQTSPDPHAWTHFPVSRTRLGPQKDGEGRVGRKSAFRLMASAPSKPAKCCLLHGRECVPLSPSPVPLLLWVPTFSAATLWPSWPLGLPTACSLTLSRPHLANPLRGQAGLSRAEGELEQIWGRDTRQAMGEGRGQMSA